MKVKSIIHTFTEMIPNSIFKIRIFKKQNKDEFKCFKIKKCPKDIEII